MCPLVWASNHFLGLGSNFRVRTALRPELVGPLTTLLHFKMGILRN